MNIILNFKNALCFLQAENYKSHVQSQNVHGASQGQKRKWFKENLF